MTFNLDFDFTTDSVATNEDDEQTMDVNIPTTEDSVSSNETGVTEGAYEDSFTDDQTTQSPFDVTRGAPLEVTVIQERSLDEPTLSDTVIEERPLYWEVVEEGTTRKRKKLVCSDGFAYTVKKTSKSSTLWRCCVRRKNQECHATAIQRGDTFIHGSHLHCHAADPLVSKRVQMCRALRVESERDVYAAAAEMVDTKMLETFENGDFNLPKKSNLVRMVNRNRQKLRPEEPSGIDFEVNLDYIKDDFLIGDVRLDDARHLIFGTTNTLRILQRSNRWYMDGTFRVVAKPFTQLYTIHAFVRQGESIKQVPLVFILMSKRRTRDYTAVLEKIVDRLHEAPLVQGFMMDFEIGLWQALRDVFPGRQMKGCAFHWGQALYKKVKNVGLQTTYQRREAAAQTIRKLLGLPFLPVADIPRAFERLREKVDGSSPQMIELFEYVEATWLSSSVWDINSWTVYKQAVRTNNDVEGWHNRVNRRARNSSLPFYVLVTLLLKEAKLVPLTVQGVSEGTISRDRRQRSVEMDIKLFNLWELYDNHEIVTEDFLRKVGEIYSGQFAV